MGMAMRFLGTGASEGIPNPFCSCPVCENARLRRGDEIRTRAAFRVTDDVQIDFGPDVFMQSVFGGNDLRTVKDILVTHAHEDHIDLFETGLTGMVYGDMQNVPNIYLTGDNYKLVEAFDSVPLEDGTGYFTEGLKGKVGFKRLEFNRTYDVGEVTVTPIQAWHKSFFGAQGANYLLSLPGGRKMLYAVDTGYYTDGTFETLKGCRLDYLMLDCTCGSAEFLDKNHMNIESCNRAMAKMYENETITDDTRVYMTHISHKQSFTHADLAEYYRNYPAPYKIQVAFDGLAVKG